MTTSSLLQLATHLLAPIVLPFQITVVVFIVVLAALGFLVRLRTAFAVALLLSFVLFIPSCAGVALIVDAFRYGKCEYVTGAEINDPYVDIPKNARSVTLHKYSSGHELRFFIEPDELTAWMDAVDKRRKDFIDYQPFRLDERLVGSNHRKSSFENLFGRHGWQMPDDVVCYTGWHSRRGSGFDVWYSPSSGVGFVRSGYW